MARKASAIKWDAKRAAERRRERALIVRVCKRCGKSFSRDGHTRKHCDDCHGKPLRKRAPCDACGSPTDPRSRTGLCRPCLVNRRSAEAQLRPKDWCTKCGKHYIAGGSHKCTLSKKKRAQRERNAVLRRLDEIERDIQSDRMLMNPHLRMKPVERMATCKWCGSFFEARFANENNCGCVPKHKAGVEQTRLNYHARLGPVTQVPCQKCGESFNRARRGVKVCDECSRVDRGEWISRTDRLSIYNRDRYACHICLTRCDPSSHYLSGLHPTLDHIWPRCRGGSDDPSNLAVAHRICNSIKSDSI